MKTGETSWVMCQRVSKLKIMNYQCLVLGLQGSVHLTTRQDKFIKHRSEMNRLNKGLRVILLCCCFSRTILQISHFDIHIPDFLFWDKTSGFIIAFTMIIVLHLRLLLAPLSRPILLVDYILLVTMFLIIYVYSCSSCCCFYHSFSSSKHQWQYTQMRVKPALSHSHLFT